MVVETEPVTLPGFLMTTYRVNKVSRTTDREETSGPMVVQYVGETSGS